VPCLVATDCFIGLFYGFAVAEELPIFHFDEIARGTKTTLNEVGVGIFFCPGVERWLENNDVAEFWIGGSVDKFIGNDIVVGAEGIDHGGRRDIERLNAERADEHEDDYGGIDEGVGEVVNNAGGRIKTGSVVLGGVFKIFIEGESDDCERDCEHHDLADGGSGDLIYHEDKAAWFS